MSAKNLLLSILTTLATLGISGGSSADELQQLRSELSGLNSTRSQMLNNLNRVQSDLSYAQDQERRDRSEANLAAGALEQYDRDYDRAKDRINELKRAVERERAQKEADIQRLTSAISTTQQQIATTDSRVASLRNEVSQLASQADPGKLAQLNSELSSNVAVIGKANADIADYEARIQKLIAQGCSVSCIPVKLQYEKNRDALKVKITELENRNNDLRRQISTLQSAIAVLDAKKRELDQAQNQLNSLRNQLPQLQSQLESARNRPIQSESELARAEQTLRSMEGQRPALERRARDTKAQWDRSQDRCQEIARAEQNLRYQIRDVDADIDRVQHRIAELEAGQGGGRRAAIVGNSLSSQQSYDISQMGMDKINLDTTTVSTSTLYPYKSSVVYLFAESLSYSVDSSSAISLEQFVRDGGVLVLVGDYRQLGLGSQLIGRSMCAYTINSTPVACNY